MKLFIFISVFLAMIGGSVFAADINPAQSRTDSPGVLINTNMRNRNTTSPATYAPTVNAESIFSYSQINSTTTITTSSGLLHSINITDSVATSFIIYDSTTTTDTTRPIAKFEASAAAGTYLFDVSFSSGLVHIGAASGAEITVSYR